MSKLTPREREIVNLLQQGKRPRHIAAELIITRNTAYKHLVNIREKLGVGTTCIMATNAQNGKQAK